MDGELFSIFFISETSRDIKQIFQHQLNIFKSCINFQNQEGGAQTLSLPRPFQFWNTSSHRSLNFAARITVSNWFFMTTLRKCPLLLQALNYMAISTFTSNAYFWQLCTANISAVKITVFRRVSFPTVIPLYYLHLITAPSTVEKCKHRFTVVYYKIYAFTW